MRSRAWFLVCTLFCVFTSGCLIMGGGKETHFEEDIRLRVRFQSLAASTDFHDGMNRSDREWYIDAGGITVPFLFLGGGVVFHETQHYTDDKCDPSSGCVQLNVDIPCDDGDPCTSDDMCASGICAGTPVDACDDGDACTTNDSCSNNNDCSSGFTFSRTIHSSRFISAS